MHALRRMFRIVLQPGAEWDRIAAEDAPVSVLLLHYLLPLALLAPVATYIGIRVFSVAWDEDLGYLVPATEAFAAATTTLLASLASVLALAGIFVLLAPLYGSRREFRVALKVVTFGSVPVLLAGATLFLPVMALVGLIGLLHSLYQYWLGVHRVLGVAPGHQSEFVGIALVLLILVSTLAGAAASGLGWF